MEFQKVAWRWTSAELNGSRSDELLHQRDELLRVTLESAPVGIAHLDIDGGWQLINQRMAEVLGCDIAQLLGMRFETLFDVDLPHADPQGNAATTTAIERHLVRDDGEVVWLQITVTRLPDIEGNAWGYVVIVEDISARKVLAHALGVAAHELRLPLSHIKGFISTLRRTDLEWDEHTRRDFLAEAEGEANRLAELIQELLDWTASGGPVAHPRRTRIHPKSLVTTTVSRVRPIIGDRVVHIDVPIGMPSVEVEVPAIERVFANLVLNADKYAPHDTSIDFTARVVGEMLELCVEDRGPGVPLAVSERIFEPFYHREVTPGHTVAGHGLGLAICRSIVTAHAGQIWVAPRTGGGARFTVALPLGAQSTSQPSRNGVRACGWSARRWPRTPGPKPVLTTT